MIRLDRPTAVPPALRGAAAAEAGRSADAWLARQRDGAAQSRQESLPLAGGIVDDPEVVSALLAAQHGKCAACEIRLDGATTAARIRPPTGAVGADGTSSAVHYAWLAYDWSNLFLICTVCDEFRGLRFPVQAERAEPGTRGVDLLGEEPLLLDPYLDDPASHLVCGSDGRLNGMTLAARTTIDCYQLNRPTLVAARAMAIVDADAAWDEGDRETLGIPELEYAGARREAIRRRAETAAAVEPAVVDAPDHVVVGDLRIRKVTPADEAAAVVSESAAIEAQSEYSMEDSSAAPTYFASTKYIESIEITNWKPVERLVLQVPHGRSDRASWLMLLGENGAGKSSILQGIALALLGQQGRDALDLNAEDFVRNGTRRAEVVVRVSGLPEPCVVTADRGQQRFGGSAKPKVLMLGYGSTRLLPRRGAASPAPTPDSIADVDNLFDPFVPMTDANAWLLGLDELRFDAASRALRKLLGMRGHEALMLFRSAGEVRARLLGSVVGLDRLSDGYQSVIAVACDVMAVLLNRWTDMTAAEGIVVLDELGAHLHPRWQMRIVAGLREVFPRVQFVATTHDPLCLRGLDNGELVVVERLDDERRSVVANQDLPPVAGLRADQLLTSELFGLRSTVDPEVEALFDEYYALLAVREPTVEQQGRVAVLKAQLAEYRLLGSTRRERLVYEAADRWLAQPDAAAPESAKTAPSTEAVAMLTEVWRARAPERFEEH